MFCCRNMSFDIVHVLIFIEILSLYFCLSCQIPWQILKIWYSFLLIIVYMWKFISVVKMGIVEKSSFSSESESKCESDKKLFRTSPSFCVSETTVGWRKFCSYKASKPDGWLPEPNNQRLSAHQELIDLGGNQGGNTGVITCYCWSR